MKKPEVLFPLLRPASATRTVRVTNDKFDAYTPSIDKFVTSWHVFAGKGTRKMANLQPPRCSGVTVTFPAEHIMLVTLSRPKQMNSVTHTMNWELEALFAWYDEKPSLRVAVITGEGQKAFCAGSDLLEIESTQKAMLEGQDVKISEPWMHQHPNAGFAGVSRRKGKKPLLAAVNGLALGGGFEIVLNSYVVPVLLVICRF